jgi:hypothetical protein
MQRRLCHRLEAIAERLRLAETVSVGQFPGTTKAITMYERHFTPGQQEQVRRRDRRGGAHPPGGGRVAGAGWAW